LEILNMHATKTLRVGHLTFFKTAAYDDDDTVLTCARKLTVKPVPQDPDKNE